MGKRDAPPFHVEQLLEPLEEAEVAAALEELVDPPAQG